MGQFLQDGENLSNFTVFLMTTCVQTFRVGLDLTCSSSRGLNFDYFPFFTSSIGILEAVSPIQRFIGNWGHLRNLVCGKSLNGANSASRSPIEEVKKRKSKSNQVQP